jgi:signal transduction histidine kinase
MQERVKLMGGRLAVQSSSQGTSVTVTLPITRETDTDKTQE